MPAWCWRGYPAHQPGHHTGGWDINTKENKTTMRRILAAATLGAAAVLVFATPAQAGNDGQGKGCTPVPAGQPELFEGWPKGNTIVYDFEHTDDVDNYGVNADGTVDFSADAPEGHHFVDATIEWDSGTEGDTSGVRAEIVNGGKTVKFSGQGPAGAAYVVNATVATDAVGCQSPPAKPKKCDAYVYAGTKQSLCDRFASASEVDCKDVKWRVRLLGDEDPWKLDDDRDGMGCEANRLKPTDDPAPPAAGAGGGQSAGSLPVTGASVPVLGGVAALLLVGGGAALVATRRRRTRFTA
jgi:LPXTG-motif cell wall-anchored protein